MDSTSHIYNANNTSPLVVAFGTYNIRKHPRVGILISGLQKNNCTVVEINHPLKLSTAQRVKILQNPWLLFGFVWNLLRLWKTLIHDTRQWLGTHRKPDAILVGYMGHFDVLLARHLFKGIPIILDHLIFAGDTARDRGAQGIKVSLLKHLDRMAIAAADLIVVDTEEHRRMLHSTDASMVIPVGASDIWFDAATSETPNNAVVFYGLYTPLQGTPIIAQALQILAQRGLLPPVTMIGNGQDYRMVHRISEHLGNVDFQDWVEPELLPQTVADHAISLGIFSTTPKGLHVVPNKVYQSMAAGCAVVTSDTPPQRRVLGDGAIFVQPGNPEALASAIEQLLRNPAALQQARQRSFSTAQRFTDVVITLQLADWITTMNHKGH